MMRNWGWGPAGSHKDTSHYYKFKGAMCLIFTCCSSLTLLILDTDAKHSQDVGWLKPLHGFNFLIENRPHLPACGEHVYVDNEYGTVFHIFIHNNTHTKIELKMIWQWWKKICCCSSHFKLPRSPFSSWWQQEVAEWRFLESWHSFYGHSPFSSQQRWEKYSDQ